VHVLVVADGDPPDLAAIDATWPGWRDQVALVIAADGGARGAAAAGLPVHVVVGDGDSLGADGLAALEGAGVAVERSPSDKDESDTELAVLAAIRRGATAITIVGAFGGRLDHALANIWLLALPALEGRAAQLLDGTTRVRLIRAPGQDGQPVALPLPGRPGDIVTLLPLGEYAAGVTTRGLRYPLRDEPLHVGPARGLSNVRVNASASVSLDSGLLVVVESPSLTP
jgi:thiamine pyrophosphokinase